MDEKSNDVRKRDIADAEEAVDAKLPMPNMGGAEMAVNRLSEVSVLREKVRAAEKESSFYKDACKKKDDELSRMQWELEEKKARMNLMKDDLQELSLLSHHYARATEHLSAVINISRNREIAAQSRPR